ncbi:MAG: hypothetical protein ACR2LM_10670 [Pyrinomonadaceae bacterium]
MSNMTVLTEGLKIGLHPVGPELEYWGRNFTDFLEECVVRGYKYPQPLAHKMDDTQIPKYDWPGLESAVSGFASKKLEPGKFLLKYGQTRFLQPLLEKGIVRIAPAAMYDDPSLSPAVRDTELEISIAALPSEVKLVAYDGKTGQLKGPVHPKGNITMTAKARSNYYVLCLAAAFSLRMFGDFNADSCLLIKDPVRFVETVQRAFDEKLPGWDSLGWGVSYIDPFQAKSARPDVHFSKHFRYAYQKEYRIVWLPPTKQTSLDPIFLELGNLEEYCELIRL